MSARQHQQDMGILPHWCEIEADEGTTSVSSSTPHWGIATVFSRTAAWSERAVVCRMHWLKPPHCITNYHRRLFANASNINRSKVFNRWTWRCRRCWRWRWRWCWRWSRSRGLWWTGQAQFSSTTWCHIPLQLHSTCWMRRSDCCDSVWPRSLARPLNANKTINIVRHSLFCCRAKRMVLLLITHNCPLVPASGGIAQDSIVTNRPFAPVNVGRMEMQARAYIENILWKRPEKNILEMMLKFSSIFSQENVWKPWKIWKYFWVCFPFQSCRLCSSSFNKPKRAHSYTLFVTEVTDDMMAPALEARQEDSRAMQKDNNWNSESQEKKKILKVFLKLPFFQRFQEKYGQYFWSASSLLLLWSRIL